MKTLQLHAILCALALLGCDSDAPPEDASSSGSTGMEQTSGPGDTQPEGDTSTNGTSTGGTASGVTSPASSSTTGSAESSGTGADETTGGPPPLTDARGWILQHFADDPTMTGDFDQRTLVEAPALVLEATGGNAKYAFTPRDEEGRDDKRVGFVDVSISDLVSDDAYGAGIGLSNADPGFSLYLDSVHIEPNWPAWVDYSTTNYDGIVLDGAAEIYGEDVTIVNWNADSAIDNKAEVSQFVRLIVEGPGNRAIRYWRDGPHYLVESSIDNPSGAVMWFSNCDTTTLYVYASTFNGAPQVPGDVIQCDQGSNPNIVYLEADPREAGDMHPMFTWPVD